MDNFNYYVDLSQDYQDNDFQTIFSDTGYESSSDLSSLSGEAGEMVRLVRYKLGEPILTVELTNNQIMNEFEQANLEYSRIYSTLQISNYFSTVYGMSADYGTHNIKNAMLNETFSFLKNYTKNYDIYGPTPVGGNIEIRRGYVQTNAQQQEYNIFDELIDQDSGKTLRNYILSNSISANDPGINITKLHHYPPTSMYRMFDPWSNTNMMATGFQFESYTVGGNFSQMIYPVWSDILRGSVFKQSDQVRRSHFSYNQLGDRLIIFPLPKRNVTIFFEWFPSPDAIHSKLSALTGNNEHINRINALWNVPMTNITYGEMNEMAKQWVRNFTVASAKETLGLIRNKYSTIPIPNGDVTLNGNDLISQGREDQEKLRTELKEYLSEFKKENLMERESKLAEMAYNMQKYMPLGGPRWGVLAVISFGSYFLKYFLDTFNNIINHII